MKLRDRVKLFRVSAAWPNISLDEFADQMNQAALGADTKAGVAIGPTSAMAISAFFCGVNLIMGWMASCKCILYERLDEFSRRRLKEHPVYRVIHDRFSPTMTAHQGWRTMVGHLILWGNAFALKVLDPYRGDLLGLRILLPSQVKVKRIKGTMTLLYEVIFEGSATPVTLTREQIFHVPGPGFNGLTGFTVLSLARESLGLLAAMEQYGADFFGQGVNAGGFLEHPNKLSEDAYKRLQESIKEKSGLKGSHKWHILEEGMKFNKNLIPLEDAQFLLSRTFQIQEVARWLNLPPHKLKELSRATFSNIEHQQIENIQDNLQPWATLIENEIWLQLIHPEEQSRLFTEFLLESLLRGDTVSQNNALAIERQHGIINANEWRSIKNRNPQEGDQGNKYLVASNMMDAAMVGKVPAAPTYPPGVIPSKPDENQEMEEQGAPDLEDAKNEFDTYGIGVRAGSLTPQIEDEDHFRARIKLPALSADARKAWAKENNVRRPVTLTPIPGAGGAGPAPAEGGEVDPAEDSKN